MKKYSVPMDILYSVEVHVEAENEEEALIAAKDKYYKEGDDAFAYSPDPMIGTENWYVEDRDIEEVDEEGDDQ